MLFKYGYRYRYIFILKKRKYENYDMIYYDLTTFFKILQLYIYRLYIIIFCIKYSHRLDKDFLFILNRRLLSCITFYKS